MIIQIPEFRNQRQRIPAFRIPHCAQGHTMSSAEDDDNMNNDDNVRYIYIYIYIYIYMYIVYSNIITLYVCLVVVYDGLG